MLTPAAEALGGRSHPLRHALTEEMHIRIFPTFKAPARVAQIVMLSGEDSADADRAHAEALCALFGAPQPPEGKHFVATLGVFHFAWERHTEFSTYTFIKVGPFDSPFTPPIMDDLPAQWLEKLPGRILRGTQIALLDKDMPEPPVEELARHFRFQDLVSCEVGHGEARVWADFRLHDDGFGRLLIRDQGLRGGDVARLVQRLQELGNYRKMALLGLPVAQAWTPTVSSLERSLAALSGEIAAARDEEERLLRELSVLSADLAKIASETRYRMSATRAYAEIVSDRLRSLAVGRVRGYQTLIDFTERRLTPAVRTCDSFDQRLEDLAQRASRASSLMRTRIDTTLERQSRDLLASMNHRTRLQLRLQQTVEGLSVVAISYYLVGLIGYLAKSLYATTGLDPALATGASVPIVLALTWFVLHRLRRRINGAPHGDGGMEN